MSRYFQLIVFDWDGTLMDSAAQIVAAMQAAAREMGLEPISDDGIRNIIGLGLEEACQALFPDRNPRDHRLLAAAYRRHYLAPQRPASPLFEGAFQVVETLTRRGYRLAVATGKSRAGLKRVLAESGLGPFIATTRCADETLSKPHPQMLLEIMAQVAVEPADTLMVGDTEYDLAMAANAGTPAVGVAYGAHARERLLPYNPLACLEHIAQLPGVLEDLERS
ncbi:MAG: HAD-IA family hydrolase [Candidatus Competibacteraceae bacterium]|nr:HAD-IA family hydrolase [Candidatus Competibacteraceae bacterium]